MSRQQLQQQSGGWDGTSRKYEEFNESDVDKQPRRVVSSPRLSAVMELLETCRTPLRLRFPARKQDRVLFLDPALLFIPHLLLAELATGVGVAAMTLERALRLSYA